MAKKISAPAKTAIKKTAEKKPAAKSGLKVLIDYPRAQEVVRPGHYSIRLTASGASQMQLRVDGREWLECRESLSHYWHDWAPQPGRSIIKARARAGKGRWSAVTEREVVVKPEEAVFVG
ncbi:MAG: hypothetical protein COV48_15095 [Elusimicrobia bacterium CG11_big_fil_rev_8_21_14_0_20_64_6]|nr:MAG: hypothetical protein COV48_15095 [Elusimicrobia bacterium CG11_big_fil_rev_8_21_14_0_20_64_6]